MTREELENQLKEQKRELELKDLEIVTLNKHRKATKLLLDCFDMDLQVAYEVRADYFNKCEDLRRMIKDYDNQN